MNQKNLSQQSEQNPSDKAKQKKPAAMINALLIGVLIGIVIYSAVNNNLGFFTLIPLYFIYRLVNQSKKGKETTEG